MGNDKYQITIVKYVWNKINMKVIDFEKKYGVQVLRLDTETNKEKLKNMIICRGCQIVVSSENKNNVDKAVWDL